MKLLTIEQAAEVLAVSPRTVERLIADGSLPAICIRRGKQRRMMRVRDAVLEKWITKKEKE